MGTNEGIFGGAIMMNKEVCLTLGSKSIITIKKNDKGVITLVTPCMEVMTESEIEEIYQEMKYFNSFCRESE